MADLACSPARFADAGLLYEERLGEILPLPDAEPSLQDTLFVFAEASALAIAYPPSESYWTPTFEDVKLIAVSKVPAALAASCDSRARGIAKRLAAYRAQFVGIVEKGKRRIVGNYVCLGNSEREDLRVTWVDMDDGGECFFGFWYDPVDGSVHDLLIHGSG